jgi:hypothetical protein
VGKTRINVSMRVRANKEIKRKILVQLLHRQHKFPQLLYSKYIKARIKHTSDPSKPLVEKSVKLTEKHNTPTKNTALSKFFLARLIEIKNTAEVEKIAPTNIVV